MKIFIILSTFIVAINGVAFIDLVAEEWELFKVSKYYSYEIVSCSYKGLHFFFGKPDINNDTCFPTLVPAVKKKMKNCFHYNYFFVLCKSKSIDFESAFIKIL